MGKQPVNAEITDGEISSYLERLSLNNNQLHQLAARLEQHLVKLRGECLADPLPTNAPGTVISPPSQDVLGRMADIECSQQGVIARIGAVSDELSKLL